MVECQDRRIDETHLADASVGASHFDQVADVERPVEQDHHPRGEVRERVLQGEAEDETRDTEASQQRAERDAKLRECYQSAYSDNQIARGHAHHTLQELRDMDARRLEGTVDEARREPCQQYRDQDNHDRETPPAASDAGRSGPSTL